MKDKIIHNIRTIRESKNLTTTYIAEKMGISQSTYSKKENGDNDFTLPELLQLAEIMEVPVVRLIDLDIAKIINQQNYDTSTGNIIDHQTVSDEGYKQAAEQYKEEVDFLKEQVRALTAVLAKK